MGFLDRVAAGAEFRSFSTLRNPSSDLVSAFTTSASYSGERITVHDAFGLGPVFAAVSIIAELVGTLPFKVFRMVDSDDQDGGERVEARQHRMWRVIHDAPNPVMPADRFWSTVTAHLLLWGNAYIEKERDELGLVQSLWLLDPAQVGVKWDGRQKTFVSYANGREETASSEQVLHIHATSLNGVTGESPISRCRQMFGVAQARSKFEGGFYRRGARNPAVIEHPGRLGKEGADRLRDDFSAWHGGVENMHKVPVLEEGASLKGLSMPLRDMEFVASQQLSRTEIATIFRLPPAYLGGSTGDSLTYATIESNQIQLAQLAIGPWTNTIAKACAADPALFPQNVVYPEFVLEALMKADVQARAAYWKTLHDMGVVSEEYIASRENLPPPPEPPKPAVAPPGPVEGQGADGNGNGGGSDALTAARLQQLMNTSAS